MRQEPSRDEVSVALPGHASGPAGQSDAALPLPRLAPFRGARVSLPHPSFAIWRISGLLALAALMTAMLAIVVVATAGPSALVPRSVISFPAWVAGPLRGLIGQPMLGAQRLGDDLSLLLFVMAIAYGIAIAAARALDTRVIVACIVVLHAILLLSPPLQLEDIFNYLGYARLGGLHGLNPYTNVIGQMSHDPIYRFTTWRHLQTPYGPLFTAATYPLAFLPLPVAYWVIKLATVLASLGFLAVVWHCARRLGRDPRLVLVFVALNPIYLFYALGGFHNDFFMLDASMAAVVLALHRRDRSAGAALAVAVAIKFTAGLLLPFLLMGVPSWRRRLGVLSGAAVAAIPLAVGSVLMFGLSLPNLATQSSLLTNYSIPNLVGDAIGAGGGAPWLLHLADVGVAFAVVFLLVRHRDWLSAAGWATLALLVSLSWLVPWYIVWVLPLAALGSSPRLRRWTIAMTVFLILTFVPWTATFLGHHNINTLTGPAGTASWHRQRELER